MISIKFLGVAFFEITTEKNVRLLVDPFVRGNPVCPIKVEDIADIDLILVTHAASDHLGDAPEIAKNTGAKLICGREVATFAARKGVPKHQMMVCCYGDLIEYSGIRVKFVKAEHVSATEIDGQYLSGQPCGFVIYTESDTGIYHAGDTAIFGDMRLIGQLYRPKIMLVGSGMWTQSTTSASGHLSIPETALAAQWVSPEIMIPCHGVEMDIEKTHELIKQVGVMAPWVKVVPLKPGESYCFEQEDRSRRTLQEKTAEQ